MTPHRELHLAADRLSQARACLHAGDADIALELLHQASEHLAWAARRVERRVWEESPRAPVLVEAAS